MIEFDQNKQEGADAGTRAGHSDELPYRIELWKTPHAVERVLGLASNAALAQAIYRAALSEHPGRRITLRRGEEIINESQR